MDVAADADPDTGVWVYDTYQSAGWDVFGGTSAASAIIAGVYALAGAPPAGTYPDSFPYADPAGLNDIVSGSNGGCRSLPLQRRGRLRRPHRAGGRPTASPPSSTLEPASAHPPT